MGKTHLTGKSDGIEVNVDVDTFNVQKITAKDIDGKQKDNDKAIKEYNDKIFPEFVKKNQGTFFGEIDYNKIDAISGATQTSNAIREAASIATGRAQDKNATHKASVEKEIKSLNQRVKKLEDGSGLSMPNLSSWLKDRNNVSAAAAGAKFLQGKENQPTKKDLDDILFTAGNYMNCHELTGVHYIVIRDKDEQHSLLRDMGISGDGTVTVLVLADGVKDQVHHKDKYSDRKASMSSEHYWQMPYAIYEAGESATLLDLAARAKGYRVRTYGAVHLYDQSVKDRWPEGDGINIWEGGSTEFKEIEKDTWDISKYSHSKDGKQNFNHLFLGGFENGKRDGKKVAVDGNLQMLCAIVIGKIDETDVTTGASASLAGYKQNNNFNYWD